jgi:nitroimidazol reductase NimA-like FMN-containing flavoprotein (pyridoxamine 5'-phosphate oxidase superfamily)
MPARLTEEEFNAFLDSRPGWIVLSTIGPDGFPHSVPLGYFREGDAIYCGVRDGTTKVRNIEANPKVSLLVESGSTMSDLKGAMIQGEARVHRDPARVLELMRLAATRRRVAAADLPTEPRPGAAYIEVRPIRRISWDYGR